MSEQGDDLIYIFFYWNVLYTCYWPGYNVCWKAQEPKVDTCCTIANPTGYVGPWSPTQVCACSIRIAWHQRMPYVTGQSPPVKDSPFFGPGWALPRRI